MNIDMPEIAAIAVITLQDTAAVRLWLSHRNPKTTWVIVTQMRIRIITTTRRTKIMTIDLSFLSKLYRYISSSTMCEHPALLASRRLWLHYLPRVYNNSFNPTQRDTHASYDIDSNAMLSDSFTILSLF